MYDFNQMNNIAISLDELYKECLITLALKIVDDTCKMDRYERAIFMRLYDALSKSKSDFFGSDVFGIIEEARKKPSVEIFNIIKPLREVGMKHVTRKHMKAFKASVRMQLLKECA